MAQKEDRRINSIIGGKWRVDKVLGSGSMATVYAVTHRNGVHAALKILHPALCTDTQVCERFLGEGYLTNQVKHPGIVRVLDDGMTDDGCVFLVMDMLEGTTLELLRQDRGGKIDIDETFDIADKLMDALHAVHSAGIIHRDLKPQNVFVCNDGSVKLLDFGVARVLETSSARNKMSLFGMVLGTPSFMSPEQAIGARDQIDHRADVYSLGATIFTALTGETVHLGPHVQAKLLAAGTVQARSISIVKQDLHPALANVIDTALRFDKADRWQSVDAFRRALREARKLVATKASGGHAVASVQPSSVPAAKKKSLEIIDKGPTRTFIGVGGSDSGKFPPARSTLPYGVDEATASAPPKPLTMQTKTEKMPATGDVLASAVIHGDDNIFPNPNRAHSGAAKALTAGIIRKPIVDEDTLDEDTGESYPAVHTPVPAFDETDPLMAQLQPKRSSVGFVFASLALIAAAIGGVAFFAMGGHAPTDAKADELSTASQIGSPASLTSATAPTTPVMVPADKLGESKAGDHNETDAGGSTMHPPAHAAITPPPSWHARTRNQPGSTQNFPSNPTSTLNSNPTSPRSPVLPEPPPANNPAPAATPSVSSDPFSTPE